jgi:hypothetical protein
VLRVVYFLLLLLQPHEGPSKDVGDRKALLKLVLLDETQTLGDVPGGEEVGESVIDLLDSAGYFLDSALGVVQCFEAHLHVLLLGEDLCSELRHVKDLLL